jgi:hypothetical protein
MGWFATSLVIGFLSCNDYLQLIAIQHIFMSECYWTSCMSCNKCNSLYVKPYAYVTCASHLQPCGNNCYANLMQLICNYHGNVIMMFIDPSKSNTWHYGDFWVKIIFFLKYDLHHPLWLVIFSRGTLIKKSTKCMSKNIGRFKPRLGSNLCHITLKVGLGLGHMAPN